MHNAYQEVASSQHRIVPCALVRSALSQALDHELALATAGSVAAMGVL